MAKKGSFQEDLKKDFDNLVTKYKPVMDKTGQNLAKAVKSAEEDIGRMYKVAQNQLEVQWNNVQKEKVYHRIGKDVAARLLDGSLEIPELEKYRKELRTISDENAKIQRRLKSISKSGRKSAASRKGRKKSS